MRLFWILAALAIWGGCDHAGVGDKAKAAGSQATPTKAASANPPADAAADIPPTDEPCYFQRKDVAQRPATTLIELLAFATKLQDKDYLAALFPCEIAIDWDGGRAEKATVSSAVLDRLLDELSKLDWNEVTWGRSGAYFTQPNSDDYVQISLSTISGLARVQIVDLHATLVNHAPATPSAPTWPDPMSLSKQEQKILMGDLYELSLRLPSAYLALTAFMKEHYSYTKENFAQYAERALAGRFFSAIGRTWGSVDMATATRSVLLRALQEQYHNIVCREDPTLGNDEYCFMIAEHAAIQEECEQVYGVARVFPTERTLLNTLQSAKEGGSAEIVADMVGCGLFFDEVDNPNTDEASEQAPYFFNRYRSMAFLSDNRTLLCPEGTYLYKEQVGGSFERTTCNVRLYFSRNEPHARIVGGEYASIDGDAPTQILFR